MATLPDEVLVDILSRLPVESLVRFKCVCKSWYALFNNPDFGSKHMISQSDDNIILVRNYPYCPGKSRVLFFLSNGDDGGYNDIHIEQLDQFLNSKLPHLDCPHLDCKGHWNGMIVLMDFDETVVLCNPATREFRILPKSCLPEPPIPLVAETAGVGCGYDPRIDDYKVVRIVANWKCQFQDPASKLPFTAEVFSLRANSTWREIIDGEINSDLWRWSDMMLWAGSDNEQFFDGVYYWLGNDSTSHLLVSFNMFDEVFSRGPLPGVEMPGQQLTMHLGVFNNESLAVFAIPFCEAEPYIDVWVMKEFGPTKSWTKKLTIGPLLGLEKPLLEKPLFFWKNYKELLHEDAQGRLFSYNLATLEKKNVPIQAEDEGMWSSTITYRKTLFFVKAREDIVP